MVDLRLRPLLGVVALACASCAVGPDFKRPDTDPQAGYSPRPLPQQTESAPEPQGVAQRLVPGQRPRADWWTSFHSTQLDALVARALVANPSVDAAKAALRVAQESVAAQRAQYYPTVSAGYNFNRTKSSNAVPPASTPTPASAGADSIFSFHTAQLTVGFLPDVFGGNRRAVESLQAQAEVQQDQLDASSLSIASNVAGAAVQGALLRQQLQLVQAMVASGEESLRIVRRQWQAGAVSHLEVALQESALAQTRQQLPALRKQVEQNLDLLRALVGEAPSADVPEFDLDAFELPADLPVSLPSQLVEQRPDLRAATAQLHAASAQVGVARAARLPQFSISGNAGVGAMQVADLFGPGGRFFSFLAGITQPVFDAGALRHREAGARANYDMAAAQYRSAVLNALQNVADSLHAVQEDADALRIASDNARAAHTVLELTQRQYGHGYLDRVALINAMQADRQASMALLQARAARLLDSIALFQALGGTWERQGPAAS
ncbi:MAG: efflux transporter outer membrane subunit [Ramlibacter sp.]